MRDISLLIVILFATPLGAEERTGKIPEAFEEASPQEAVPEPAWRAMKDRLVRVVLRTGEALEGQLIAIDPSTVTLILTHNGTVVAVSRVEVTMLQAGQTGYVPPPAQAVDPVSRTPVEPAVAPEVNRHVGIHFGGGPAVLALDFDYRPFYAFLSGGLAFPLFLNDHTGAVMVGAGGSWRVKASSAWQFDLFAHFNIGWGQNNNCVYPQTPPFQPICGSGLDPYFAIGVGAGFHYTFASGFAIGIKAPIFGVAFGGARVHDPSTYGGYYYLSSVISMPMATLGYRF